MPTPARRRGALPKNGRAQHGEYHAAARESNVIDGTSGSYAHRSALAWRNSRADASTTAVRMSIGFRGVDYVRPTLRAVDMGAPLCDLPATVQPSRRSARHSSVERRR